MFIFYLLVALKFTLCKINNKMTFISLFAYFAHTYINMLTDLLSLGTYLLDNK